MFECFAPTYIIKPALEICPYEQSEQQSERRWRIINKWVYGMLKRGEGLAGGI